MTLGIDIGGTTIGLGLLDEAGTLVRSLFAGSFGKDDSLEGTVETLKRHISGLLTSEVRSIGIGVPSALDREEGVIYNAINIPSWKNVPLKQILEDSFGLPVRLNNDANCFALGAYRHFKDECPESLVGVTLGTGVGVGLVIDGRLYNGHNTGAGEIGCIPYLDADLETYCSSHFFTRNGTNCKKAAKACCDGDPSMRRLFEVFGRHVAHLVQTILYAYDPAMIVLGGGISRAYPLFKESMDACLAATFLYPEILERLTIRQLDNEEIALTGAALLS
jgi:glucokinase